MPIIGFSIIKMETLRNKGVSVPGGRVEISSGPKITNIEEVDVSTINKKVLQLTFEFTASYKPDVGHVRIEGEMLYLADDNKPVLDQWNTEKKLPKDMGIEVHNHLYRKCLVRAATLAEELNLPSPILVPNFRPKEEVKTEQTPPAEEPKPAA